MEFDTDFTHVRRQDRAVKDEAWIEAFLQRSPVGMLATALQDQPYVHANLFVYDPQRRAIFFHSAKEGRTISTVRNNPKVCFTAAEMGRLLPHAEARGFGLEYSSVVVFGVARLVEEPEEMLYGLRLLMEKYAPHLKYGADYQPLVEAQLQDVAVYCIEITGWSGKRRQGPDEFPNAYRFEDVI